ncbi:hypothetical protein CVD28_02050 [Bacillus sp. M6-12]|uniref:hypothetical protein n=1 Tax=Bacillus sp. M6-12 TaxID=2054166 RepID=UPI000C7645E4|nr:hypothetical protein [Bacillus sp. M6-12]PLS19215.1 hypothetical protein CVD28_02050 [Bacillus sp. M6-12]
MQNQPPYIQVVKEIGQNNPKVFKEEKVYAGIDEVGVSSIAGSLVCSVVILPANHTISRLPIDSKVLHDNSITEMAQEIEKQALYYAILAVSPQDVDKQVQKKGMLKLQKIIWRKAIETVRQWFPDIPIVLDGKHTVNDMRFISPIIGADRTHDAVSASAILSKYWCDEELREEGKKYPHYLLAKHKGYPTTEHLDKIRQYGTTSFHRPMMTEKALEKPQDIRTFTLSDMEKSLRKAGEYLKEDSSLANESTLPFLRQMWKQVIQQKTLPSEKQQRFTMNVCREVIKNQKRKTKKQTS